MMTRKFICIATAILALMISAAGCVKENMAPEHIEEGVPVVAKLKLGMRGTGDITISTKAELNSYSDIISLFLFIYNADGTACEDTLQLTQSELIDDGTDNTVGHKYHTAKFKTTSGEKKILGIANFKTVENWKDFQSGIEELGRKALEEGLDATDVGKSLFTLIDKYVGNGDNGTTIEFNSAQMIFTGAEDITVNSDGTTDKPLELQRIVANISFKIQNGTTEQGNTVAFAAKSYKVYNLPSITRLAPGRSIEDNPAEANPEYYYNTIENEISSSGTTVFEFFMPENIQPESKTSLNDFHQREEWDYNGNSGASPGEKKFTHVQGNATFVVISGEYSEYDKENNLVKSGNTNYTIHLGDFSKTYQKEHPDNKFGNYSVRRNCSYSYTITIKGVEDIVAEAEAESGSGEQQGAEGDIVKIGDITKSFSLDAHYEQILLEYNISNIYEAVEGISKDEVDAAIGNYLVLHVNTPFQSGNVEIHPYTIYSDAVSDVADKNSQEAISKASDAKSQALDGKADYKWVEFLPQSQKNTLSKYPGLPEWKGGTKSNTHLIDAYDLCVKLGKVVRKMYDKNSISKEDYAEDGITVSKEGDGYYAYFTGFVDENYYYENPLTGSALEKWSDFVNKDARTMMISMEVKTSEDGNSTSSSVHTYITQRAIQTFYDDTNAEGLTAFGMETFNETPFMKKGTSDTPPTNDRNGRNNTLDILGVSTNRTPDWDNFVKQEQNGFLKSIGNEKRTLDNAYASTDMAWSACMSRNRDMDGDGKIDMDEVKWYLPAINEYLRIGLGAQVISGEAQLYTGDKNKMTESDYPNSYIQDGALYYTSTSGKQVYWAVEKGAYGYEEGYGDPTLGAGRYSIRCVRILPKDLKDLSLTSDATFTVKEKNTQYGTSYVIDCRNKLVPSLYRVTPANTPFVPHNEDASANRFYEGFVVSMYESYQKYSLSEIQNRDGNRIDPCTNYYENGQPSGSAWRVPNLTELIIMASMPDELLNNQDEVVACTQFSNMNVRRGFWYKDKQISCSVAKWNDNGYYWSETSAYVRCVRDTVDGELDP